MENNSKQNKWRIVAIVLLILIGLNALAAGYGFTVDPTGSGLGITTDYLKQWVPFKDFLIPGLILFIVLGLGSLLVAALVVKRTRHYPVVMLFHGILIVGWIAIQLLMVTTFHPLHAIVGGIGLALTLIGLQLRKQPNYSGDQMK